MKTTGKIVLWFKIKVIQIKFTIWCFFQSKKAKDQYIRDETIRIEAWEKDCQEEEAKREKNFEEYCRANEAKWELEMEARWDALDNERDCKEEVELHECSECGGNERYCSCAEDPKDYSVSDDPYGHVEEEEENPFVCAGCGNTFCTCNEEDQDW